ncbi:class I SAM-dependent methyltransferase [Echinicola marina]|uniref:class I SAM-dependent methyltransferase n=1 Tax=Echinicola marina TaxID=2859768 RepID=UPI001CF6E88F|nr:class I SAM-dependent methyltransferase [Echinicola marina]UCS94620.1 class I SAM-dependent methyltransferase [Echinicola marina]
MNKNLTADEWKAIGQQLGHPKGELGLTVAKNMQASNVLMVEKAVELLHLTGNEKILEIGYGPAAHVEELLEVFEGLEYHGLEISELMHQAAHKVNSSEVKSGKAQFHLYDGKKFPFASGSFDKVMTVNTIYFWEDPKEMAGEVFRVLEEGGNFSLAFAQKSFLEKLPFTQSNFKLYDVDMVEDLMYEEGFTIIEQVDVREKLKSDPLGVLEREFTVMRFIK